MRSSRPHRRAGSGLSRAETSDAVPARGPGPRAVFAAAARYRTGSSRQASIPTDRARMKIAFVLYGQFTALDLAAADVQPKNGNQPCIAPPSHHLAPPGHRGTPSQIPEGTS